MIWWLGWAMLLGIPTTRPASVHAVQPTHHATVQATGRVWIWTDQKTPYARGDQVRVFVATTRTEHVTVVRIDTDGRLRILFPREPWADNQVRARTKVEIPGRREGTFHVNDQPGIGYLFALSSREPFEYGPIARGDHWDFRLVNDGRVVGDPFTFFTDLAARLAPEGSYDYDVVPYQVEGRYDYPRFVCYECHAVARRDVWDPYRTRCSRFRLVIYEHPAYYPYYRGGRRVVTSRPPRIAPRFVFRDRTADTEYVTHVAGPADPVERAPDTARATGNGRRPAPTVEPATVRRLAPARRSTGEPELKRRKPDDQEP